MQIEKHCFEHIQLNCDKMNPLGSMAMPETLLITKAFDQQLRALANKVSFSYAENDAYIHTQTDIQCNSNSNFIHISIYSCTVSVVDYMGF